MKKSRNRDKYFINNECHSRIFGVLHWFKMNCISGIVFKKRTYRTFLDMFWVVRFNWSIKLQHSNDLKQSFLSVYPDDTFSIFSKIACVFPIPITGNYFITFERKCVFFDALNIRTKFFSWMIIFSKKKICDKSIYSEIIDFEFENGSYSVCTFWLYSECHHHHWCLQISRSFC